jgi:hypothetical protein
MFHSMWLCSPWRDWNRTIGGEGLTINVLIKLPADQQIIAACTLLKVVQTLATGEVRLYTLKITRRLLLMRLVLTRFHRSSVPRG